MQGSVLAASPRSAVEDVSIRGMIYPALRAPGAARHDPDARVFSEEVACHHGKRGDEDMIVPWLA